MSPYPEWHTVDDDMGWGPGLAQKKHHKKHHKRPDVAERGMDEEVHGFVKEAIPPLNTRVKSEDPFVPNGSDASAHEGAAFSEKKHHKKHNKRPDVAERGMDEEVHGFVKEAIPPLNTRVKSEDPFVPNGSDASAHEGAAFSESKHHKKHNKNHKKGWGISDEGMDSKVHGFVTGALKDYDTEYRSPGWHIPNGSDAKAFEGSAASEK
jgi:uncharacterized protein involved in copper resistance